MADGQSVAASLLAPANAGSQAGKGASQGKATGAGEAAFGGLLRAALAGLAGEGSQATKGDGDDGGKNAGQAGGLAAKLAEKARNAEDIESFKAWVEENVAGPAGEDLTRLLEGLNQGGNPRESAEQLLGVLDGLMGDGKLERPSREGLLSAAEAGDREAQREALLNYDETDKIESEDRARYLVAFLALLADGAGKADGQENQQAADGRASVETEQAEAPNRAVRTGAGAQALTQMLHQQGSKLGNTNQPRPASDGQGNAQGDGKNANGPRGGRPAGNLLGRLAAFADQGLTSGERARTDGDGATNQGRPGDGPAGRFGLALAGSQGSSDPSGVGRFTLLGTGAGEAKISLEQAGTQSEGKLSDAQRQELVRLLSQAGQRGSGTNGASRSGTNNAGLAAQLAQYGQAGMETGDGQASTQGPGASGKAAMHAELPPSLRFALGMDRPDGGVQVVRTPAGGEAATQPNPGGEALAQRETYYLARQAQAERYGGGDASPGRAPGWPGASGGSGAAMAAAPTGGGNWSAGGGELPGSSGFSEPGGGGSDGQRLSQLLQRSAPEAIRAAGGHQTGTGPNGSRGMRAGLMPGAAASGTSGSETDPSFLPGGRAANVGDASSGGDATQHRSEGQPFTGQIGQQPQSLGNNAAWLSALGNSSGQAMGGSASAGGAAAAASSSGADSGGRHAPPRGPARQMAGAIQRAVGQGQDSFTIRLQPPQLGRVDVKMDLGADGSVRANLAAERPETLDLLRQDARALERALQEAGLKADSDSLNFSLRDERGQSGNQEDPDGQHADGRAGDAGDGELEDGDGGLPPGHWLDETGRLDVSL